jgi:proteasome beta subunit
MDADDAVRVCVEALWDAADDDSATGGPDLARGIFPVVAVVDAAGYRRLPDSESGAVVRAVVDARQHRPDGPAAGVAAADD